MVICGWSLLVMEKVTAYPLDSYKHAIIFLLNTLGDVIWHYSFRSVKPAGADLVAENCRFAATND
jgi:hypothetical protein